MGWLGLTMVAETPWMGVPALALLFGLPRLSPRVPVAPLVLLAAVVVGAMTGQTTMPNAVGFDLRLPPLVLPGGWGEVWRAVELAVVPQLPLTLTNAVIITAAVGRDLFPDRAARASVRNLALTSGATNLLLAPFGAMPMCHGAGGVVAHHRFGARTGLAPVLLGIVLLVLAFGFASSAAPLFAAVPASVVGALLLVAGTDLAMSKRLFDARLNCWPAIAISATATALLNPAVGLSAGCAVEAVRSSVARGGRRTAARG
jgi:MFS superfamily sulfate permease-like transporter